MRTVALVLSVAVLVPSVARAQPPGDALANVDNAAAAVELSAATLSRASDLSIEEMQRLAVELQARMDLLSDLSAPYPLLAAEIPQLRVTLSELLHEATLATRSNVETHAETLLDEMRDFRNTVRDLRVAAGGP
jgi:hypothetical protein